MAQLGFMAVDQYNTVHHLSGKYPRKQLLKLYDRKHADKIYRDTPNGGTIHVGWIIAGRWFNVYQVHSLHNDGKNQRRPR